MPRTLIRPEGASRRRSLGRLALWWIETFVVHGGGDVIGRPVRRGAEYGGFIYDCYAVDDDEDYANYGRLVDSAFFSRPKGCDKSGMAAHLVLFEALGPCRFAGWAQGGETFEFLGRTFVYEPGEAMGKTVTVPEIRIMATEEGQAGNTFDTVYYNLTEGPLSALAANGMDAGQTRVLLPGGGAIRPMSTGASSKDGGKETFVVFDETHLYNTPALRKMYATVKRNLSKRKKGAGTWFIETTTMYAPGEDSVAEETYKLAQLIQEGKFKGRSRLLYDHRGSDLEDLNDLPRLREAIQEAYGEALEWNSLGGVIDEIYDTRNTVNDSRRFWLNALVEGANAWLTTAHLARATAGMPARWGGIIEDGEKITLGFDGAQTEDATALIACRVSDGTLFPLRIEEKPDGPEAKTWRVNEGAFDAAVAAAMKRFEVVGFFADPPWWQEKVEAWEKEFGQQLAVSAMGGTKLKFWTKMDAAMALAAQRLKVAIDAGKVKIVANPQFLRHLTNARVDRRRGGDVVSKDTKNSVRKIDAAVAAILAYEARARYLALGEDKTTETWVPRKIR